MVAQYDPSSSTQAQDPREGPSLAGRTTQGFLRNGLTRQACEEAETPTSNQSPRGTLGRRLLGPAALRTCPFASLLSQVRARLGPGGYCRRSGNGGSPDLPACGLRRGSRGVTLQPSFINTCSRPSRGAKPRGVDDRELPQGRPHQAGSRGGGEIKAGVPREVLVMQAMTIETKRAPGARRPA